MPPSGAPRQIVLNISCPDRVGIVHAVSGSSRSGGSYIVESQQFGDPSSKLFFQCASRRRHLRRPRSNSLGPSSPPSARDLAMTWEVHDVSERPALLIMVSRLGHCLNDLLYRYRTGALRAECGSSGFEPSGLRRS